MANENVIQATFDGFYKTYTEPSWLIDHGMELSISGIDLPDEFECHFSNSRSVAAKRQIGENGVVTIPDEYFLSNAAQIFCWIYLHPTVDSGVTEYEIVIPLRQRPNVNPAEPTQEQQDIVDQAIAALNVAMGATSADAESALASATAAQEAADSVLSMTVSADTLPAGVDASVTKSVVDDAVHLAFGIPQGAQGVQGEQGPIGATPNFTIGTVQTLLPTQDATATITGTAEAPVLNLGIPKGDSGDANNLAADYSSTKTYAVGDYCVYNGSLYRCTTPITTAETWTAAHWTAAVLGDDVCDLKSALTDISNVLSIPYSDTTTGTTPQSSTANTIIDEITLESGKSYTIDLTYSTASDAVSYLYLTDSQINVLNSKTINAGTTSVHVVYYAQNSYENAKLLINSTNRALDYELTIREDAETKIDALERDKLSAYEYKNAATFTFASAATMTQPCPVKNGSVYKITVTGEASVAANVRSGNGYTKVDDIATDCYAGNTYFAKYTGANAPNLIVFASGACTVTVEDISTLSGSGERRIYATVSTVRELLECIEISHTVKMTIYLMDGVYDLISGLGASYFENAPSQNFGPVLCNDVEIVGGEGSIITANYTGDNTNVMTYFAPFNAGKCVYPWTLYGGFSLINVHLEGSKIRYLVHDENNQHDIPYHNVYDGCYFYFDNSGNTSWGSQAIIGGGLGKHGYIEIKNCVFKTPTLASRSAVVSYHNSLAAGAKSHIVLTGNLIAPTNAVFRLGYHGTSEEKTLVLATNNKWGGAPSVSAETSSDTVNNFDLQEWNNVVLS